ncbi:MAG TPA: MFS transporter [Chloroflexota bacterium]|nr:MFS transporter [Chloroflexota bacterium]
MQSSTQTHHAADPPVSNPRSWRTTFSILWICQTGMFIAFQSSLPFIALYIQQLGVPDQSGAAAWAGAINGAALAVYAVMNVVWGALSDRWGLKGGLIRSQLFAAAGFLGAALAQRPEHVLLARLTSSIGGGANSAALSLVATLAPSTSLGMAMGLMQTGASLGGSLGPAVGGFIGDYFGFRYAFIAATALALITSAGAALFVKEPPRPPRAKGDEGLFSGFQYVLHSPALSGLILLMFVYQTGYGSVMTFVPLRLQELVDHAEVGRWSGAALIGDALGIATGASLLGWLSARLGERRVLMVSCTVAAITTAAHLVVHIPEGVIALRFLMGLCTGGFLSVVRTLLGTRAEPSRRGIAFGISQGAYSLAISVASITGSIAIQIGGLTGTFIAASVILMFAVVWSSRAVGPRRIPDARPSAS